MRPFYSWSDYTSVRWRGKSASKCTWHQLHTSFRVVHIVVLVDTYLLARSKLKNTMACRTATPFNSVWDSENWLWRWSSKCPGVKAYQNLLLWPLWCFLCGSPEKIDGKDQLSEVRHCCQLEASSWQCTFPHLYIATLPQLPHSPNLVRAVFFLFSGVKTALKGHTPTDSSNNTVEQWHTWDQVSISHQKGSELLVFWLPYTKSCIYSHGFTVSDYDVLLMPQWGINHSCTFTINLLINMWDCDL